MCAQSDSHSSLAHTPPHECCVDATLVNMNERCLSNAAGVVVWSNSVLTNNHFTQQVGAVEQFWRRRRPLCLWLACGWCLCVVGVRACVRACVAACLAAWQVSLVRMSLVGIFFYVLLQEWSTIAFFDNDTDTEPVDFFRFLSKDCFKLKKYVACFVRRLACVFVLRVCVLCVFCVSRLCGLVGAVTLSFVALSVDSV